MKDVRLGIIGIGNMGSSHAKKVLAGEVEGLILMAVADVKQERLDWAREKLGEEVARFDSAEALIKSGLCDAVIVAVPHFDHPKYSIMAMRAGLHVMCEKPAGVYTEQVLEMNRVADECSVVFALMMNQRTNCVYRKMREIVKSGEMGKIRRTSWIITDWYRPEAYYSSGDWRATWSGEGGGVLINQAPHNLDLWQWICGMPVRLRAECSVAKYHDIEVEDEAQIFAKYENGATAVFITSTGEYPGTTRLEITGSKGKLVLEGGKLIHYKIELDETEYRLCESGENNSIQMTEYLDDKRNGHCEILKNFASAVLCGTPLFSPGEQAINELMISNAAYLSAWTDRKVSLPADEQAFLAELDKRRQMSVAHKNTVNEEKHDGYINRWNTNW